VAHGKFLRFDFSDIVRRTPSANPAAAEMKIKTARGMVTVANSRCVSTGSVFWTTRIATKMAKTDATMSFRLRMGYDRRLEATAPNGKIVTFCLLGFVLNKVL
jgi:hypothetical protein